jgi:hypothetical protein
MTHLRCWLVLLSLAASLQTTLGYYDPAAQRWITRDPIQESGGQNLNAFVANQPTGLLDGTGLSAVVPIVGGPCLCLCKVKCTMSGIPVVTGGSSLIVGGWLIWSRLYSTATYDCFDSCTLNRTIETRIGVRFYSFPTGWLTIVNLPASYQYSYVAPCANEA